MREKILVFLIIISLYAFSIKAQWQWKSPNPQGNNISNLFIGQNNSLYGIGDFGTMIFTTDKGITWRTDNAFQNITEPIKNYFRFNDQIFFIVSNNGTILESTNSGSTWFQYSQIPGVSQIGSIYFTSLNTCYVINDRNKILKSDDGGLNWNIIYSSGSSFLNSIRFVNDNIGFASGGAGFFTGPKLFKTTDAGKNWDQMLTMNSGDFYLKKFTDDSTGFGILNNKLYKTTDQGLVWNLLPNNYSDFCNDAFIFSEDSIVSIHSGNSIRYTINGGLNWVENSIPEYTGGICFESFEQGFILGGNNRILSIEDLGNKWSYISESNGSGSASNWIKKISFVNNSTGFVCGWNSYFRKTTDKGETWTSINTGLNGHINDLDFVNETTGYLVGGNSGFTFVAKTTNGGLNFNQISSFNSYSAGGIDFINSNTGFILGYYSFHRSSDAGINWSYISFSDSIQLYGIDFINQQTGFVSGQLYSSFRNKIYKTTDSGLNWHEIYSAYDTFYNIDFANNSTGYVCGRGIYKTTDGGVNWFKLTSLINNPFLAGIEFINPNTGFVCGYGVYKTTDGGNHWETNISLPTNVRLEEIKFFNQDTGIVIGDNGVIIKTYNGGGNYISGIINSDIIQKKKFSLSQNYPNPFNPKTIINYQLAVNNVVNLKVYDALGKEVTTLVNEKQNAGSYSIEFNGEGLPSGVYFYKLVVSPSNSLVVSSSNPLETGEFVETKRMVLLK